MEYFWKRKGIKKSRYNIGFLAENAFSEYISDMITGVFDAAKKYDANIIRFAYYEAHAAYENSSQIKMVLDYAQQFDLDGLLFIGWTKAAWYKGYENFRNRFSQIPVLSIAKEYEDTPSVIFPGDNYVRELIIHLIEKHQCKRIAYIPPYNYDNRNDIYIEVMKEYGIYDPLLYINEKEIANLEKPERGLEALSILIDKHKVSFDAIVSLYNEESAPILGELKRRGLIVPDDVVVVTYEDGEISRSSSPALTTVYFPWWELGYYGCEKLVELLEEGHIPQKTVVYGKINYRSSCGCFANIINPHMGNAIVEQKYHDMLNEMQYAKIAEQLGKSYKGIHIDFEILVQSFFESFRTKSGKPFIKQLEMQLREVNGSSDFTKVEDIVPVLRKHVLPYFSCHSEERDLAEGIFHQAQHLVIEKGKSIQAYEKVQARETFFILQKISQILYNNYTVESVMDTLEQNLPKLKIPSCYIFLFDTDKTLDKNRINPFERYKLIFDYSDNRRTKSGENIMFTDKKVFSEKFLSENRMHTMLANLLHVTDDFIGVALYEPGPLDEKVYQSLSVYISTALRGVLLVEELDSSYKRLVDQAHSQGMAEIATGILHNVGNVLNSINISVEQMKQFLNHASIGDFVKANKLLEKNMNHIEDFICNDEKGKKLMNFYLKLGETFVNNHDQMKYHMERVDDRINLIGDIISAQQSYAGLKLVLEELNIITIIEDALKLQSSSLEKFNIKVIKQYPNTLNALVQRTKLFHILINLIKNAKEAMIGIPEGQRELIITAFEDNGSQFIRIRDKGYGIANELLSEVFIYGYTTKIEGHGFGLHSSSIYMAEMGGKIWAESDGAGKGATFVLQFKPSSVE